MRAFLIFALIFVSGCVSQAPTHPANAVDAPRVSNAFLAPVNAFAPLDTELQPGADLAFEEIRRLLASRKIAAHTNSLFSFRLATNAVMHAGQTVICCAEWLPLAFPSGGGSVRGLLSARTRSRTTVPRHFAPGARTP